MALENDKKKALREAAENQEKMEIATQKYFNLKEEVDKSPLAILRNELGTKQLEVVEMENKLKASEASKEEFRARYEQVKKDMIGLKRQIDLDKEHILEKQAKELESLKNEMRQKEARDAERREFEAMRGQFATMADRLQTHA